MIEEVARIGLDPKTIAVGTAGTFAMIEIAKKVVPTLFPEGTSGARSLIYIILACLGSSLSGYGPLAGNSPDEAAALGALFGAGSWLLHDKVMKPLGDPLMKKAEQILKEAVP